MHSLTPAIELRRRALLWALVVVAAPAVGCREHIPPPPGPAVEKMDARRSDARPTGGTGGTSSPDMGGSSLLVDMGGGDRPPGEAGADLAPATEAGVTEAGADTVVTNGCGSERPNIAGITNADGVAIGADGTLYFTQVAMTDGYVGRLRPGGAMVEKQWLRVPMGARLWGLAVDAGRRRLYMASASGKAIHYVDLAAATPALQNLITGLNSPNDIAIAKNGDIYFSEQGDSHIYRVTAAGMRNVVTKTAIGPVYKPAGLAFGPDGGLYLGTSGSGPILRFDVANGVETFRRSYGHYIGWGNGLVFDERGRLYLSTTVSAMTNAESRVVRIATDDSGAIQIVGGRNFGGMAFGRGALNCSDLYIASSTGPLQRFESDVKGLALP